MWLGIIIFECSEVLEIGFIIFISLVWLLVTNIELFCLLIFDVNSSFVLIVIVGDNKMLVVGGIEIVLSFVVVIGILLICSVVGSLL